MMTPLFCLFVSVVLLVYALKHSVELSALGYHSHFQVHPSFHPPLLPMWTVTSPPRSHYHPETYKCTHTVSFISTGIASPILLFLLHIDYIKIGRIRISAVIAWYGKEHRTWHLMFKPTCSSSDQKYGMVLTEINFLLPWCPLLDYLFKQVIPLNSYSRIELCPWRL